MSPIYGYLINIWVEIGCKLLLIDNVKLQKITESDD